MNLFLIRHLESEKNVRDSFSSLGSTEKLTENGLSDSHLLGITLSNFVKNRNFSLRNIYTANSTRAISSCAEFARTTRTNVVKYDELLSDSKNSIFGLTKEEARTQFPEYMYEYRLYQMGLFNIYNVAYIGQRDKRIYESSVIRCLFDILSVPDEDAKFVFLHRSSMTAILLYFARHYLGYPDDFFGYVPIDLGHVYWLRMTNQSWHFIALNVHYELLPELSGDE